MNYEKKIPVTIITGFLGAGKTTFINFLLKSHPEINFALVENEFGEVDIDTQLIKGVDASQMFELKQGCICCTISDEYELVLLELAERFPSVDHLLIETTGIADPATVIQPFFRDENVKAKYRYNGTVCLVDALNFNRQPEKEITRKQLVIADLIVLNKIENLTENQKNERKRTLQQLNPWAKIVSTTYGCTPVFQLNNIQQKPKPDFEAFMIEKAHSHIQSKTLYFEYPLPKEEFLRWLSYTLDIYKNHIYRVKGILCFQDELYEVILQGVGGSYELEEGGLIQDPKSGRLVYIGKDLEGLEFNSIF